MAIRNRWGAQVLVTGNAGTVQVERRGQKVPLTLVRIEWGDRRSFRFAETLNADAGYNEIMDAVDAAPVLILRRDELEDALRQAE